MDKLELIRLILASDAPASSSPATDAPDPFSCMIGRYCIVRATAAGVHAGVVKAISAPNASGTRSVVLANARRMWTWHAASGVSLSGCAAAGIIREKSKIEAVIPEHAVDGVCEIIPTTTQAQESIHGAR